MRRKILITDDKTVLGRVLSEKLGKDVVHIISSEVEEKRQADKIGKDFESSYKKHEDAEILRPRMGTASGKPVDIQNLRKDSLESQQPEPYLTTTGRNSPCDCGSGKKYKKCCLIPHMQEQATRLRIQRKNSR